MAFTLSTGSSVSIANTYDDELPFSAASNGANCELTVTGSDIVAGDFIEVKSGWDSLDLRIVRAGVGTSATSIILEGVDTSDTRRFPTGTGTGTVRKVLTWTQITQLRTVSSSGGEQNFADITTLANWEERSIPTTRSAVSVTLECFDDPNLPWVPVVRAADEARTPRGFRLTAANGSEMVANGYWSLGTVPNIAQNEALTTNVDVSFAARPMRYGAAA